MVALTGCAVAIVATAGAATPAVLAGAQAGASAGIGGAMASTTLGAATAVGGSAAIGGAAGAITGSAAAGAAALTGATAAGATGATAGAVAFTGAAAGGATGATAGAAVSSIGAGILAGPIGWIVLGVKENQSTGVYTFDCWKPIVHDNSSEPSNGITLKEIAVNPRIKQITTTINDNNPDLPYLVLENIWEEQFRIEYVYLPSGQLAAHAVRN